MDCVEVEDMGVVMFQFITMIAYSKARRGGALGRDVLRRMEPDWFWE